MTDAVTTFAAAECAPDLVAVVSAQQVDLMLVVDEHVALTPTFDPFGGADDPPNVFEAWAYPNESAACFAQLTPRPTLLPVLSQLVPAVLDVDGQIDALIAVERHIGLLQARAVELLAALDAGDDTKDGFTRDCVAAALRVPPGSLRSRMTTARDLAQRHPATLALLRAGAISQRHAFDLAEATSGLTAESAAAVEAHVLVRAADQTVAQFRASLKRAVLRVSSPAEEEAAHTHALTERRVVQTPADRGMACVNAYLSADDAATVMAALDALAHATIHGAGGDTRIADQRRADALVDLCAGVLSDPYLVKAHGQRPAVQVTVAASTLMGLDDQPGELDGYGAITAGMARGIAADPTAQWRRGITNDDGLVQHVGAATYRPPADMARTVIARDVHCVFPGCRRKAKYNDLDHVREYSDGGETTIANLMSLCRRHHRLKHARLKHHGEWTVERNDTTGVTTWTDPHGRRHQSRPPTRPTTTTGGTIAGANATSKATTKAMANATSTNTVQTNASAPGPVTAASLAALAGAGSAAAMTVPRDADSPPF